MEIQLLGSYAAIPMLRRSAKWVVFPDDGSDTRALGRFVDVVRGVSFSQSIGYVSYLLQGEWI